MNQANSVLSQNFATLRSYFEPQKIEETIDDDEEDVFGGDSIEHQQNSGVPGFRQALPSVNFQEDDNANQEIQDQARNLLDEVKKNDSARQEAVPQVRDTASDLAELAKKMAVKFASMAQLVNTDDRSGLIKCAKEIAVLSNDIEKLGKIIVEKCDNKKLANRLAFEIQTVPTIATQLKIVSTVKAATMHSNATENEVEEAMETLVLNCKNLMSNTLRVVRAADGCGVVIRYNKSRRPKF